MSTQKQQQKDDATVASLATYKELRRYETSDPRKTFLTQLASLRSLSSS